MQEKEDDLSEGLSFTNCLPADGAEQEFHFSSWQFMQASAELQSFGGMEQPGCCCPHLSTMVAFSPAGWTQSRYVGRKTNPSTATICKSSCCLSSCVFFLIKEKSCFRAWEDPRMHLFCLLFKEHFTHFSMMGEEKHCTRRRWKNGWGKK